MGMTKKHDIDILLRGICLKPVSYTHLDVYKRQVYDRLDSAKLKKAIYIFMAVSGAVTLINSLLKLFGK